MTRNSSRSTAGRVFVVGSANMDRIARTSRLPSPGETVLTHHISEQPGGKGANQAAAAARAGVDVVFIGSVGRDSTGAEILRCLDHQGVEPRISFAEKAASGTAWVMVADSGENAILVSSGANLDLTPDQVHAGLHDLAGNDVVLVQTEVTVDAIAAAASAAEAAGARLVLNNGPWLVLPAQVLRLADPLIVNEHEAATAIQNVGTSFPKNLSSQLRDSVGCSSTVVTLGAKGASVDDGAGHKTVDPAPVKHVVDSTGAGDAFAGALAASLATGASLSLAVQRAIEAGAEAVQWRGAQPPASDAKTGNEHDH